MQVNNQNLRNMEIIIKSAIEKTFTLEVEGSDTISHVKEKIQDKTGTLTGGIVFADRMLDDRRALADYNIQTGSVLVLLYSLQQLNIHSDAMG